MTIPYFKSSPNSKRSSFGKSTKYKYPSGHRFAPTPPKGFKSRKRGFWGVLKFLLPYFFIAFGISILFCLTVVAWYSRDLPRPDKIIDRSVAQSTKIFDRTGEHLLFEVHGSQRRTIIPLEQIPKYAIWATVLAEDKNFYQHKGFDLKGIARAILKDIFTLSMAQGGSTLTQQLVKNALLSNEKALSRKIKELVLSYQIERKFSKDQIIQLYFNEIPYGSSAYGIESASQFYFNKSAKDLTIAQAAILAALPKAPTYYSPHGAHVDELMARKDYIIDLLAQGKIITEEETTKAKEEKLEFSEEPNLFQAPHFVIMVKEELARKYGEREVEQGGLKVITTLDYNMQKAAQEAVDAYAKQNETKYGAKNASLVAIDPKTGQILAMIGSRDYFDKENQGNFNVATQGKRQPGSSFKPFVYAAGFGLGYTDKTTLWDVVTNFGPSGDGKDYIPHNYSNKENGPISIRSALAGSLNIPAVKMIYLVGINKVLDLAKKLGYTTFEDRSRFGLSVVLGGAEVKLIDHTSAYATLANEGVANSRVSVLKVEDATGKVLEEYKQGAGQKVLDIEITRLVTDIISDNSARAYIFGQNNFLNLGERPVACKTGTTNDFRDAWAMGYTPSLAVGVWTGNNNYSAMKKGADGSAIAAPIWNKFLKTVLAGKKIEYFNKPNFNYPDKPVLRGDLGSGTPVKIDRASGKLATDLTPASFIEEKIFRTGHNILHYVKRDDPLGPAPAPEERDSAYSRWEEPVQKWLSQNSWTGMDTEIPTEYDDLHVPENWPNVSITEPFEGQTIETNTIYFKVDANAPRGISRVEFYVDGVLIDTSRIAPYIGTYIPDINVSNGFHELKVIAYDDIDNSRSAQVNFNLFLQK